jgi:N6-adenosine-specific RNA methylase IME4
MPLVFTRYPKQQRLLALKKASVTEYALPPLYLPFSELASLQPSKFDVIVIDPPMSSSFSWDTLQELPLASLAADPSFVFLWVGSGAGDGLERGREVLAKWGYRRCEDVCWVKTNRESNRGPGVRLPRSFKIARQLTEDTRVSPSDRPANDFITHAHQAALSNRYPRHRTTLHRLLVRPLQRRYVPVMVSPSQVHLTHASSLFADTDVILWEGDPTDPTRKPPEMYTLIENFCLGLRRLELFARARSLRRGWVSVLEDGEEANVPTVQAQARAGGVQLSLAPEQQLDAGTNVLGQELSVDRAERWDQEKWETGMRGWLQNGRSVVPMTPGTFLTYNAHFCSV